MKIKAGLDPALCQSCLLGKKRQGSETESCVVLYRRKVVRGHPLAGMLPGAGEAEILSWCFLCSLGLPCKVLFRAEQMCGPSSEIRRCVLSRLDHHLQLYGE